MTKKILSVLGAVFLVGLLAAGGFIGFAAYRGHKLDASSKAYVEDNIPKIAATWSKEELAKRSSPKLRRYIDEYPNQLAGFFQRLSGLGRFEHLTDVKGDSQVLYHSGKPKTITATYQATAGFANGNARIAIRLVQRSGQWEIQQFHVDSPILRQ